MKNRFPTAQRATWRERFIAIARQADAMALAGSNSAGAPRRPAGSLARSTARARFAALSH